MTLPPAYNPKAGTAAAAPAPKNALPPLATSRPPGAAPSATETALRNVPIVTAEGVMQRLRYFENLAEQHEGYISQLKATITRLGGAVPVAYFAPLSGAGGTHAPKSG